LADGLASQRFARKLDDLNYIYFNNRKVLSCNYSDGVIRVSLDNGNSNYVVINQPDTYPTGTYASQPPDTYPPDTYAGQPVIQHQPYFNNRNKNGTTAQNVATPVAVGSNVHYPQADTVVYVTPTPSAPVIATAYVDANAADTIDTNLSSNRV
jgi:hypothetical protein